MERPVPLYRGDDEYVFVCYSHRDAESVYDELQRLHEQGVNFWYDDGIRPGSTWTDELAGAIVRCSKLVFFITPRSAASPHCRDEVQYALSHDIPIIAVYLEETELPPGLELSLGSRQAVLRFNSSRSQYESRLLTALSSDLAQDLAPKGLKGPKGPRGPVTGPVAAQGPRRGLPFVAAMSLILVLGWYGYDRTRESSNAAIRAASIAMLPLQNRGGFDEDAYYPDSISEDLLNRLVAIDGLAVVSRRASFRYRDSIAAGLKLSEVAAELGVRNIITGYIRKTGSMLQLSLELVDVASEREIIRWSNRYADIPVQDMLRIQAEVTRSVARVFFPAGLSTENEDRLTLSSTQNSTAYEYYLEAHEIIREPLNQGALDRAETLFSEALALDPDFAWAQAGLCSTYLLLYQYSGDYTKVRSYCERLDNERNADVFDVQLALGNYLVEIGEAERALVVIARATELNSRSADARIALARAHTAHFHSGQAELDLLRAREAYLEAIATEPQYWLAYHAYGIYLIDRGELDEAERVLLQALEREPTNTPSITALANIYYRNGQTEQAAAQWQRTLELKPGDRWANSGLGILKHYEGDYVAAVRYFEQAIEAAPAEHSLWGRLGESYRLIDGGQEDARRVFARALELATEQRAFDPGNWRTAGYQALYFAYLGQVESAQKTIAEMFALNPGREPLTHFWAALVYSEAGNIDRAFSELDLALRDGFSDQKRFITEEPALQSLRKRYPERYQALLDRY